MDFFRKIKNYSFFELRLLAGICSRYFKQIIIVSLVLSILAFLSVLYILKSDILIPSISEGFVGTYTENELPKVVTNLMSRPLIYIDASGSAKPDLLESFTADKQAKKYTLKLKKSLTWINGEKIKIDDFDILVPDAKFKKLDERTVEVNLADSFSPFPTLLTKPILRKGTQMGTGPYTIDRIEKSQIFIRKIVLKSPNKNLPTVIIRFYPSEKIAKNALRIGEIQSLLGVADSKDLYIQGPYNELSKVNYSRLVAIFYNTQDKILSDRNFRLSLSFAAPSIKEGVEAKSSIPPTSWAFNPSVRDYLDNPELAKSFLTKVQKGAESTITLTATTPLKNVGERIVKEWNKQGIKAILRVESGIPQNFQALLMTAQDIPADPDQYSLWHSTQSKTNISHYFQSNQYSPRVDKDLEDGRKTTDLELRKARYFDLQKVLMDDAPATPLYFPKFNIVYLKKVEDTLKKVLDLQLKNLQLY